MDSYKLIGSATALDVSNSSSDKDGSGGLEGALVSSERSSLDLGELGELEASLSVLSDVGSLGGAVGDKSGLNDMEALMSSGVSTRDLGVKLSNSAAKRDITVLLVHVDIIVSSEVLEDNTVVLHGGGLSLEDLADGDDFTLNLSDFVLSLHLVPEVRSSNNSVLGEHSDSVASGLRVLLRRSLSTDNPVLSDLNLVSICNFIGRFQPVKKILTVLAMELTPTPLTISFYVVN